MKNAVHDYDGLMVFYVVPIPGFHYFRFNFIGEFRIIDQKLFYGIPSLSQLGFVVTEPGSAFLEGVL
jgi:hypothetical protein